MTTSLDIRRIVRTTLALVAGLGAVPVAFAGGPVTTGGFFTCMIDTDGSVRCWGENNVGQLGYGDTERRGDDEWAVDLDAIDLGGVATQIGAGTYHACALLDTGAVRCWGKGAYGALGYGDRLNIGDDESPADAGDVSLGGPVSELYVGNNHNCVILDSGDVRCWGNGAYGKMGLGNSWGIGDDELPTDVGPVDLGDGEVEKLALGANHTCALMDDGAVRCWGFNGYGQLGYGHTSNIGDNELPASAGDVNLGGVAVDISAGSTHTCAVLDTGAIRCWGYGYTGALGYGNRDSIGDNEDPAAAGDVDTGGRLAVAITSGQNHNCALLDTSEVLCWGSGYAGQLGNAHRWTIGDDETLVNHHTVDLGTPTDKVLDVFNDNGMHTCVERTDGQVQCWGAGGYGQLGNAWTGNIGDNETAALGSIVGSL
ncbi:MAG: hypothetical protein H6739_11550 [Alphaproteobacteria bacterium]|nr:hypothetical protein [Alphaproteobacteria bacterium]